MSLNAKFHCYRLPRSCLKVPGGDSGWVVVDQTSYHVNPTWVEVGLDWIELKLVWMLGWVVTTNINGLK